MRTATLLVAALAALAPSPTPAQLSTRSIALESGACAGAHDGATAHAALALSATAWLEGELEAVARLAIGSAPEPEGRAADALSGTLGLRLSLAPDPVRPQLSAEIGWSRVDRGRGAERGTQDRLVVAVGAGVEAFAARDLSIALRTRVGFAGGDVAFEATVGVAAYF